MKVIPLKRLLNKREITALLRSWSDLGSPPITMGIANAAGKWVISPPRRQDNDPLIHKACQTKTLASTQRATACPLIVQDELYGVFYIESASASIRDALHHTLTLLLEKELARKSLAQETLDRYREINLLYRVHETIGASLDLAQVIHLVLEESIRIIKADGGTVLLRDELTDDLTTWESVGIDVAGAEHQLIGLALSDKVMRTGRSRILNDLRTYVRPNKTQDAQLSALLSAPFKSQENVLGVITLARAAPDTMFTAGDEKLLMALASQAGVAIANAQEVQKREARFKQQIQALKIEIDQAKKQKEVEHITESDYFKRLQEHAQYMRDEFDI